MDIITDRDDQHFSEARSSDGRFLWLAAHDSYVSLDAKAFGLPDRTMGKVGRYPVYLPVAASHAELMARPDHEQILSEARRFAEAVEAEQDRRRELAKAVTVKESTAHREPCPHCGTWCEGDCQAH